MKNRWTHARCADAPAERLLSAGAGLLFKGSGFYITDYRSDAYKKAEAAETGGSKDTAKSSDGSTSKPASESSSAKPASGDAKASGDSWSRWTRHSSSSSKKSRLAWATAHHPRCSWTGHAIRNTAIWRLTSHSHSRGRSRGRLAKWPPPSIRAARPARRGHRLRRNRRARLHQFPHCTRKRAAAAGCRPAGRRRVRPQRRGPRRSDAGGIRVRQSHRAAARRARARCRPGRRHCVTARMDRAR